MNYLCSECNTEIKEKEFVYSKKNFGNALCRTHQKKEKVPKNKGLTKREGNYAENMIKGRIAETLIEELFLALKYNVFRYGMENTVPGIMELLRGVKSEVAYNIKRMPDFVVQHPKTKDVYFIEVKFRAKEEFDINDKSIRDYPYENAYFIIVSKKHIKCISYSELKEGKKVTPNSKNYLGDRKEFTLDKKVIIDFCKFATKFFENV